MLLGFPGELPEKSFKNIFLQNIYSIAVNNAQLPLNPFYNEKLLKWLECSLDSDAKNEITGCFPEHLQISEHINGILKMALPRSVIVSTVC